MVFKGQLYIPHFVYLFIRGSCLLAIVNNAAVNIVFTCVQISFQDAVFNSFEYIPRNRIAGSSLDFFERTFFIFMKVSLFIFIHVSIF